MLDIAVGQPASTLGLSEVWIPFLRQHQTIGALSAARCLRLTAVAEALQAVLPDSLEHPETRFIVAFVGLLDQALVNQRGHHIEDFGPEIIARVAYGFRNDLGAEIFN